MGGVGQAGRGRLTQNPAARRGHFSLLGFDFPNTERNRMCPICYVATILRSRPCPDRAEQP